MPASNNSRPFSKNLHRNRLSLATLMILSCGLAFAPSETQGRSTQNKVRAVLLWSPPNLSKSAPGANELEVRISDIGGSLHPILQVFSDKKTVFTCEPDGLALASVYQLEDGNLATLWHTGCGGDADTHFIVFTYLQGKVHQVLDADRITDLRAYKESLYADSSTAAPVGRYSKASSNTLVDTLIVA